MLRDRQSKSSRENSIRRLDLPKRLFKERLVVSKNAMTSLYDLRHTGAYAATGALSTSYIEPGNVRDYGSFAYQTNQAQRVKMMCQPNNEK
jgi:hypothetical protein